MTAMFPVPAVKHQNSACNHLKVGNEPLLLFLCSVANVHYGDLRSGYEMTEHRLDDLFFMARALDRALTDGIADWASDTDKRTKWLETEPLAWHVFSGTMLVGLFAFTEGKIGRYWWDNLNSGSAKRDLAILWRARNSFVHADGQIVEGRFNRAEDIRQVEEYCASLTMGELRDDKGNIYPIYMTIEGNVLRFNKEAINQFRALFEVAFQAERLGRMPQ